MQTHPGIRPSLILPEPPAAIAQVLAKRGEPLSVREIHRALLEYAEVDYGLVLAVTLYQTTNGVFRPRATTGRQ